MSSKKLNIFDIKFDSYGEAVDKYLEYKRLTPKWLAQNIIERFNLKKPKLGSLQSMISRWAKGDDVSHKYQVRINNILDITINQDNEGKWTISRTKNGTSKIPGAQTNASSLAVMQEERSRYGTEDIPDTELGRELQDVSDDVVSLFLKLRRLIEIEKNRSDD